MTDSHHAARQFERMIGNGVPERFWPTSSPSPLDESKLIAVAELKIDKDGEITWRRVKK